MAQLLYGFVGGEHFTAGEPFDFSTLEREADDAASLRWVRVDSYIAVYRFHEDRRQVVLLKLLSATSNWRRRILP